MPDRAADARDQVDSNGDRGEKAGSSEGGSIQISDGTDSGGRSARIPSEISGCCASEAVSRGDGACEQKTVATFGFTAES